MARKPLVLITGANGALGRVLADRLPELGWSVRKLVRTPIDGDDVVVGSVCDTALMERACSSVTAIVHLAGVSVPGHRWSDYLQTNIDGTRVVLEAARRAGVERVALASSNHAVGYLPHEGEEVDADIAPRPDSFYGVSKAAMEALGSYYADEFGLKTTSLRVGSCTPTPTSHRMLATWLSEDDFVRLTQAALTGPWHGHSTVWGISRNTRRWWSLDAGERIGYFPQDDAEVYAAGVPAAERAPVYLGGNSPGSQRGTQEYEW